MKASTRKLVRCIRAPIRVLCKARDMYVKSMNEYAGRMHHGASATTLPKSFSLNSSRMMPPTGEDDDLRALIRVASQRAQKEREEKIMQPPMIQQSKGLPKSFSVAIWRIDEEKPCDFEEDFKVNSGTMLYPRSRSSAVAHRRMGLRSY